MEASGRALNKQGMRQRTILLWFAVHKWTGLVCTAFLLMLCVTGLPLIFHEEIDRAMAPAAALPPVPAGTPTPTLDRLVAAATAARPGEVPLYLSFDEERPVAYVTTARSPDAPGVEMTTRPVDARTAALLPPLPQHFTDVLLRIHVDMFLGEKAEWFLGFMGVLFAVAIVSGVVLYVPFMRRLAFGTVRLDRGARVRRLDRHNLLGVATLLWAAVVGLTGTLNTLAGPITRHWQAGELAALGSGGGIAATRVSVERTVADALRAAPGTRAQFVAFPGAPYGSRRHLAVYLQGATPLTRRLLTPVFVDAASGRIDAVGQMPWYMSALLLAQPLHFGDYGGLPLKFAWAVLDLLTIAVLWTGLRLWLSRRLSARRELLALAAA